MQRGGGGVCVCVCFVTAWLTFGCLLKRRYLNKFSLSLGSWFGGFGEVAYRVALLNEIRGGGDHCGL